MEILPINMFNYCYLQDILNRYVIKMRNQYEFGGEHYPFRHLALLFYHKRLL